MRVILCAILLTLSVASSNKPAKSLLVEFQIKREKLGSFHQEFEVLQTYQISCHPSFKRRVIVDMSGHKWREQSVTESGVRIRIFDGRNLFTMEEGGGEYVKVQVPAGEDPQPYPYGAGNPDWARARETGRRACGFSTDDHSCILFDVPLKPRTFRGSTDRTIKMVEGSARMLFDPETGVITSSGIAELFEDPRSFQSTTSYAMRKMRAGASSDVRPFELPSSDMKEVKELSRWNASKIKQRFEGKTVPELTLADIHGNAVSLSALYGRTVLLDFWTTWCEPCRADGPALDKLYSKYHNRDFTILGIAVSEDRPIVEEFLKQHPHSYPIALTSENKLAASYEISVLPTYIVIGPDGRLTSAVEGDQGFGQLRKLLKKAGLNLD